MERVQSQGMEMDGAVVPSLAPLEHSPPALDQLALTARSTPGVPGREAVDQLHAALRALAPTEENAGALLRLLDEKAFHELSADDGTSTRELAVETLLGLGYPWALQIHPDELAWYRRAAVLRVRVKLLILLLVITVGALAAAYLLGA